MHTFILSLIKYHYHHYSGNCFFQVLLSLLQEHQASLRRHEAAREGGRAGPAARGGRCGDSEGADGQDRTEDCAKCFRVRPPRGGQRPDRAGREEWSIDGAVGDEVLVTTLHHCSYTI